MQDNEKIYILIHKEFTGEISGQEIEELSVWINQSAENKDEYKRIKETLRSISVPSPELKFDTDSEWAILEDRLNSHSRNKFMNISAKYYGIAASFLILISVAIFLSTVDFSAEIVKNESIYKKRIKLPDNSVVVLNKNTEISYSFDETARNVNLTGEAYFEVQKDKKSFVVNTPNSSIKVLGTKFNVEAGKNYSKVAVKSGKVAFSNQNNENVVLTLNQYSECNSSGQLSKPLAINVDSLIHWTEIKLIFEDKTLKEILDRLEKEYTVKYIVKNSDLLNKKLSAVFENQSLKVIHKSIGTALKIFITKKGNTYYISE